MKDGSPGTGGTADASMPAMLAALAHPARIEILRHLSCHEVCHCKDVVAHIGLAQSTVSQHLKVLVGAGLVRYRPERQRSRYSVNREALQRLVGSLQCLVESCGARGPQDNGDS